MRNVKKSKQSEESSPERRAQLLARVAELAGTALVGSASETYRTCGNTGCRCHHDGPKHGPHMYVNFRSAGKNRGYYVPKAAQSKIRTGLAAWRSLQDALCELAELNRQEILAAAKGHST